jgi:hypothetical protein
MQGQPQADGGTSLAVNVYSDTAQISEAMTKQLRENGHKGGNQ